MIKLLLLFCLLTGISGHVFAQENQVQGIVFDKATKERIARVLVTNLRSKANIYNNLKGEFAIEAKLNDLLVFSRSDFYSDTVRVSSGQAVPVYLKRSAIALREITIRDSVLSAQQKLEANKKEFSQVYGSIADKNLISTSGANGAGVSIDALYNLLSRRGRNASKLRGIIDRDYQAKVVDERFNPIAVSAITGLKDKMLESFMYRYRPDYNLVVFMDDYDFISYIKSCYRRFMRNPSVFYLPQLKPAK